MNESEHHPKPIILEPSVDPKAAAQQAAYNEANGEGRGIHALISTPENTVRGSQYPPGLDAMIERLREMAAQNEPWIKAKDAYDYDAMEAVSRAGGFNCNPEEPEEAGFVTGGLAIVAELLEILEGKS